MLWWGGYSFKTYHDGGGDGGNVERRAAQCTMQMMTITLMMMMMMSQHQRYFPFQSSYPQEKLTYSNHRAWCGYILGGEATTVQSLDVFQLQLFLSKYQVILWMEKIPHVQWFSQFRMMNDVWCFTILFILKSRMMYGILQFYRF